MQQTSENYRIEDYRGISIECWSMKDLVGLRSLLHKEGCPKAENHFSDEDKAVELDEVQRRISQKRHTSKMSSTDIMLHVNRDKLLLCDAKFNLKNIDNLDRKEIDKKITDSKAIIISDYSYVRYIYLLVPKKLTDPLHLSLLKRKVSLNPNWKIIDAEQFRSLFAQE